MGDCVPDEDAERREPVHHDGETVNREQLAAICRVLGYLPEEVRAVDVDPGRVLVHTVDRNTGTQHVVHRQVTL